MADSRVTVPERPAAQGTRIAVLYTGIGDYIDLLRHEHLFFFNANCRFLQVDLYPESFRIPFSPIIFLLEKKHIMRLDPRRMPRIAPTTGSGSGPRGTPVERPK